MISLAGKPDLRVDNCQSKLEFVAHAATVAQGGTDKQQMSISDVNRSTATAAQRVTERDCQPVIIDSDDCTANAEQTVGESVTDKQLMQIIDCNELMEAGGGGGSHASLQVPSPTLSQKTVKIDTGVGRDDTLCTAAERGSQVLARPTQDRAQAGAGSDHHCTALLKFDINANQLDGKTNPEDRNVNLEVTDNRDRARCNETRQDIITDDDLESHAVPCSGQDMDIDIGQTARLISPDSAKAAGPSGCLTV